MDNIQPTRTKAVRNWISAITSCVLETVSELAQAAIMVPNPGISKLRTADTIATGFETYGTLDTSSHT